MKDFLLKDETYAIVGLCMEVHSILGHGFKEIVYKDAIAVEASLKNIQAEREKKFSVMYKNSLLKHSYCVDFIFYDKIIVEVKAGVNAINNETVAQTLNYLKASGRKVGLIVNFGGRSLEYKRLIL